MTLMKLNCKMNDSYQFPLEPPSVSPHARFAGGRKDLLRFIDGRCRIYNRALTALELLFERFLFGKKTVTILTTSQSKYISACVTDAAKRHGKWSRIFEEDTAAVVVIHEWGFAYPHMAALTKTCRARNIPLIEDCARAFGTYINGGCGRHGDYVILSAHKFFGVKKGVMVARNEFDFPDDKDSVRTKTLLAPSPRLVISKRRRVFEWHRQRWERQRLFWLPRKNETAEAFILPCGTHGAFLRKHMRKRGVEGGCWFGNRQLFLPCHHNLMQSDVNIIGDIVADGFATAQKRG